MSLCRAKIASGLHTDTLALHSARPPASMVKIPKPVSDQRLCATYGRSLRPSFAGDEELFLQSHGQPYRQQF